MERTLRNLVIASIGRRAAAIRRGEVVANA
ncbi:hypothetical protein JOF42_002587 [Microbacterium phyllosphaerae]|uniref:Uncharacterized protein n=1 Tax=Microbacterium phyllosphaerae TaxID=124798 RepID=A0ABS4WS94_9MICO|nr:hypothetical protein [Microbacterium phyllosphaerae]